MYLENMEAHNYNQFIIEQKIAIFLIHFPMFLFFCFFLPSQRYSTTFFQLLFSMHFFFYQCVLPCNNSVTTIDLKISDERYKENFYLY